MFICGYVGYKFIQYKEKQNAQISQLQNEVELLKAENEDKNAQISQLQDEVESLKTENNI